MAEDVIKMADTIPWQKSCTAITRREHLHRAVDVLEARWPSVMRLYGRFRGMTAIVVGGGVSIENTIGACFGRPDVVIFAINQSYDWCIKKHGLVPHFGVICDVGSHTVSYQTPDDASRFLIAAQVDPNTLRKYPKDRTFTFFQECAPADVLSPDADPDADALAKYLNGPKPVETMLREMARGQEWNIVYPTSTTPGALIYELDAFAFARVEWMGVDGCLTAGCVHPYKKIKTDVQRIVEGVTFTDDVTGAKSPAWDTTLPLARQVIEWQHLMAKWQARLVRGTTNIRKMIAHGDGPIPWMMKQRGLHVDCEAA